MVILNLSYFCYSTISHISSHWCQQQQHNKSPKYQLAALWYQTSQKFICGAPLFLMMNWSVDIVAGQGHVFGHGGGIDFMAFPREHLPSSLLWCHHQGSHHGNFPSVPCMQSLQSFLLCSVVKLSKTINKVCTYPHEGMNLWYLGQLLWQEDCIQFVITRTPTRLSQILSWFNSIITPLQSCDNIMVKKGDMRLFLTSCSWEQIFFWEYILEKYIGLYFCWYSNYLR